jgi:hypothetical protein
MTQDIIEKAKSMLAGGYNMNQIAAMLMVDRVTLSAALIEKPKKSTKVENEPLFVDEPGL